MGLVLRSRNRNKSEGGENSTWVGKEKWAKKNVEPKREWWSMTREPQRQLGLRIGEERNRDASRNEEDEMASKMSSDNKDHN